MRYQIVPVGNGLAATGSRFKLSVRFEDGQRFWRVEVHPIVAAADRQPVWSAASPDLPHVLTSGLAALRTLDTDGLL